MIKVNLLNSVTERDRSVAVVEERVSDPRTRTWMLLGCVGALMLLGMAFDYVSANSAHRAAQAELVRQQQVAAQMAAINKEQADLEKKIKDTQARIDAIKRLRATQQGPVAALSAINERLPAVAEFRLEAIEQKNGELSIEGHSPNENAVTQFGRSLEFSSGLFTNVNMETERKAVEINASDYNLPKGTELEAPLVRPETVRFKIKCKYTQPAAAPAAAPGQSAGATANQVAQK